MMEKSLQSKANVLSYDQVDNSTPQVTQLKCSSVEDTSRLQSSMLEELNESKKHKSEKRRESCNKRKQETRRK